VHEDCGGALERLLSAPALRFKGTGWYVTDYARANGKQAGSNGDKGEPKRETKPPAKTETSGSSKSESAKSDK
jgi:predicted nucleic acid-binding Zn ribbon protein